MMENDALYLLFARYIDRKCTPEQEEELAEMLADPVNEPAVKQLLEQYFDKLPESFELPQGSAEQMFSEIINTKTPAISLQPEMLLKRQRMRLIQIAAAVVLLFISYGAYLWLKPLKTNATAETEEITAPLLQDIPPGGNRATLQLANGTVITLDSIANGALATQGGIQVLKQQDGVIAYEPQADSPAQDVLMNTITTPRGGQYQLTLTDGSKVWLNAASSLRFPAAFTGNQREVALTGEGYFEVAKNAAKPFKVILGNGTTVEVLGTHFNIMSYEEEDMNRTTLLEGSVKLTNSSAAMLLKPGQQAVIDHSGKMKLLNDVDTEEAIAWKDGFFKYNSVDLQTFLRQAARWYDIDVEYRGKIPAYSFSGKIPLTVNFSKWLRVLELSEVHYTLEGRTIIIKP